MNRIPAFASIVVVLLAASGCGGRLFDVNLFILGEQTTLEKQVLGSYEALGEDLLLYGSVRGVEPDGSLRTPPPATDSQRAALEAMRNREYNRDDIEALLTGGVVGEGADGLLAWRDGVRGAGILGAEEARRIVEEENADRETLVDRLMATTPGVGPTQEADVRWIFARLNQDDAPEGAWIADRDGTWRRK